MISAARKPCSHGSNIARRGARGSDKTLHYMPVQGYIVGMLVSRELFFLELNAQLTGYLVSVQLSCFT